MARKQGPLNHEVPNPFAAENSFIGMAPESVELPTFESARPALPQPTWAGRDDAIDCYWKVWQIAFANLRRPTAENRFVANYIDTAFNECLFMWDSAFILMFARYGCRAFDFQRTLDNLYAQQSPGGYIPREVQEWDGQNHWELFDPVSTGPNVLAWSEWEHFTNFADRDRLARVFPVLVAYHQWMRLHRTWPDGGYWTNGYACGMDNQPRIPDAFHERQNEAHHGWLTWIDACCQQALSARLLLKMAEALGRPGQVDDLRIEHDRLAALINKTMWHDLSRFYCDTDRAGRPTGVKSVGAYWAVLADLVPAERMAPFLAHLEDGGQFNRPHRVPSLSADHPKYEPTGGYWLGGVWPPTNYMLLRGLTLAGRDELAHQIARNHVDQVVEVFRNTGTVWENYAPEQAAPGKPARKDFVGWSGLGPVAVLFEYVFGLRPDAGNRRLVWDVRLLAEHGVKQYPFGPAGLLDAHCPARNAATERPLVQVRSNVPLTVELRWPGGREEMAVPATN